MLSLLAVVCFRSDVPSTVLKSHVVVAHGAYPVASDNSLVFFLCFPHKLDYRSRCVCTALNSHPPSTEARFSEQSPSARHGPS